VWLAAKATICRIPGSIARRHGAKLNAPNDKDAGLRECSGVTPERCSGVIRSRLLAVST